MNRVSPIELRPRGFTLIEMLVSIAIFTVVMVIALGALLAMSSADRKAESLKSVVNNLNFSIDSMARSLRTGTQYNCGSSSGGNCTAGGPSLYFTSASGVQTAYRLENLATDPGSAAAICGQVSPNVGCVARSTDGGSSWYAITSPEVVINPSPSTILFYLIGAPPGTADNIQPKVVMTISGTVQVTPTDSSTFHVQTAITQRFYDQ